MIRFLLDTAVAADEGAETASMLMSVGVMVLFFVVFYLILIRPQRKRDKELKKQISEMSIGDKIITIGGLVGVLASVSDDEVTLYTSVANTPITFQKAAIQTIIPRNSDKKSDKKSDKSSKSEE